MPATKHDDQQNTGGLSRREFAVGALAAAGVAGIAEAQGLAAPASSRAPAVRITDIESFGVRVPEEGGGTQGYSLTRVHTDAGVVGTAFLGTSRETLDRWIKPTLLGEDLFAIDRHLKRLQMERGESGVQSWSAVEHAMWDAVGKIAGRPVAQLLGGYRDRIKVYRTSVWPGAPDQSDVPYEVQAEFALHLKNNGYKGMKVRAWRPRPMDDVEMVRIIREAVGDDFDIMLDRTAVRPGWVWDYQTALQVARGLERWRAAWLEEPFDGYDLEAPARLAAEVDIPITGGELGKSIHQYLGYLTHRSYDILHPDARICGGIWIARKVGILAEAFQVPCILHGNAGPALAGWIQASCAMPNCEWQEAIGGPNLPEEQWAPAAHLLKTDHVFQVEDGHILLPDVPGLGLDIDEAALAEYRRRA